MTLKKLFATIFGTILIGLISLGAVAFYMLQNQNKLIEQQNNRYASYQAADELRQSSQDLTKYARTYVSTGNKKYEDKYWEVLDIRNGVKRRPDGSLISLQTIMEDLGFTDEEFAKLTEANNNSSDLVWTETIAMNAVKGLFSDDNKEFTIRKEPDFELARNLMFNQEYDDNVKNIMAPINLFFEMLDERTKKEVEQYSDKGFTLLTLIIVLIAIVIISIAIAYSVINKKVINVLGSEPSDLKIIADKIATGELNFNNKKISNNHKGVFKSIVHMNEQLKSMVQRITETSDSVAGASFELNSSSQQIANGVNEQAASAEEVSSAMEEMAANIQQNTENAVKTQEIASKSSNAMSKVSMASEDSMNAVKDIHSKINVVVEIAEKTDLLAINAAVEAARAGEQGRGFAVVAAEVRKLAERSQLAANNIVELAQKGMDLTQGSTTMLKSIVPDIIETSRLVEEIATSSREQETGAHQVNSAIQQLNMVTQQNASSSEELASSATELTNQANELESLTRHFVLDSNRKKSRTQIEKEKRNQILVKLKKIDLLVR